jgi:hypothetical protein
MPASIEISIKLIVCLLSSVSGCRILIDVLLLGYLTLFVPIHKSVARRNMQYVASSVINRLRILFNLITSTTRMRCK